jgi:hypothetical protein
MRPLHHRAAACGSAKVMQRAAWPVELAQMKFTIAIEAGTKKSAFGVAVPDLSGCFSAGDTVEGDTCHM